MTTARVTSTLVEVARQTTVNARVTSTLIEVARTESSIDARVTSVLLEVARINYAESASGSGRRRVVNVNQ